MVQVGRTPADCKPKFERAVYVLHAFQKKTQETAKADIDLSAKRYKLIGGKS